MPYLTYAEFQDFDTTGIDETKFESLLPKASAVLDNITNHYYVRNDILVDNSWRVRKFKEALSAQIEYFNILGATSFESINSAPQTFSAGRTTVTNNSRSVADVSNAGKSLAAEDVYIYLEGTGLLYRGIGAM